MLKRIIAFVLLLLPLSLSVVTAQDDGDFLPPLPDDQQVTLTYYNYNLASAGLGADGTQQLIDEFMALHPNITIDAIGIPSTDILSRTQADFVAGTPPDIAQLVFDSMSFIVDNLGVQPLESIIPPAELEEHLSGMHPRGIALGQLNGNTYGLAYTFSTPVLFYNADIFREAGLDPDDPPETWEEVEQYALQIVENTDHMGFFPGVYGQFDWMWQGVVLSNGGRVLSEDRTTLTFAEEPGIEAAQMLHNMHENGAHADISSSDAIPAMLGGNLGMYLQTSALQSAILRSAEGNFEVRATQMPRFGDHPSVPTNSGSALFILTQDPVKARAAWEFLRFVTSERGYTIITSQIGYLPLRPQIVDDPEYLLDWAQANPLIYPNLEQLDRLEPWESIPGPNYTQIVSIMMNALEEAVYGDGDVAEIMTTAQERGQALMP